MDSGMFRGMYSGLIIFGMILGLALDRKTFNARMELRGGQTMATTPRRNFRKIQAQIQGLADSMQRMKPETLDSLNRQFTDMTTSNCYWLMYWFRVPLMQLTADIAHEKRAMVANLKAAGAGGR